MKIYCNVLEQKADTLVEAALLNRIFIYENFYQTVSGCCGDYHIIFRLRSKDSCHGAAGSLSAIY